MDLWRRYLFESHPEATLRAWAKRLHMFRFFRAYGGHADDVDELVVVFRYGGLDELRGFFTSVGIDLVVHEVRPPRMEPGRSYRGDELERIPPVIPGTEWIEQPRSREIGGQRVFVWCHEDRIKVSVGSEHGVTEADVAAAEIVERRLVGASLGRDEPPIDTMNCICPKYYPDYFG